MDRPPTSSLTSQIDRGSKAEEEFLVDRDQVPVASVLLTVLNVPLML
jgi:hypothetical protein